MIILFLTSFSILVLVLVFSSLIWALPSRLRVYLHEAGRPIEAMYGGKGNEHVFYMICRVIIIFRALSNIPMFSSITLYYFFTCTVSLCTWASIIFLVYKTQLKSFIRHMMPYGAPMFLALLLPLVEIFSHIIRPFTLRIRLSTNLSSGHIMLFIFSYFSLSSFLLSFAIVILLLGLILLEISISILQSYIFTSLSNIYYEETL